MKLEKLKRNCNFEIVEENVTSMLYSSKNGTPVVLNRAGTPIVKRSVIYTPTGMCVAGNLHLEEDGGKDKITLFKTGCLIQKAQENLLNSNDVFYEHTFISVYNGKVLFILQDLDNEFLAEKKNGKFSFNFSGNTVTITKRLLKGGDVLKKDFSYRELSLNDPDIIFDNSDFYNSVKDTQGMS